jgi:hypothetical protein
LLGPACESPGVLEDQGPSPAPAAPEPPLFTLQTMHPSTPPLLVQVFNDPSDANIERYLEWEHRYLSRILEVDARLKQQRKERKR